MSEVDSDLAQALGMEKPYGALINSIEKDQSADNADLKAGDVIIEFNGEEVKFQSKDFILMMGDREELREQIYKKICEETILQYKGDTLDIDNMEVDTKGAGVGE